MLEINMGHEQSVLITLPTSTELQDSSAATLAGEPRLLNIQQLDTPQWIFVDPAYAPVAIGNVGKLEQPAAALSPSESNDFIVRATVDENRLEEVLQIYGKNRVFSDPYIAAAPTCGGDPAVGATGNVAANLDVAALHAAGLNGRRTAMAIMDTGINRLHLQNLGLAIQIDTTVYWKRPHGPTPSPGLHPVHHGTMCAYDALIAAPKTTLLDYPILGRGPLSSSDMGGALSNALSAYAHLLAFWSVAFGPSRANYDALVVNNSWGMYHPSWDFPPGHPGRYADNPSHPFNQIVSVLSSNDVDILFAAGNCGNDCPDPRCQGNTTASITGANAHSDVICVGGVDTNDNWVGYSSQGPAISGMDQEKPDISAYTHFAGSNAFAGHPDTGTSTACPVAAGCVAALRTVINQAATPPAHLTTILENTARKPHGPPGWDLDLGHGIINPVAAARRLGAI